ncbi:MAG: 5'-methylthioadenosine/S-adenosylhomocysteine nucleosidase [Clostridia bacterium]|nr:5'-methylthioadenosine/S-adenosylhomocysteine nucleosidase [Clostridia bacterium]
MKLGILCAGDRELAPFLLMLTEVVRSRKALLTVYEGCLDGLETAMLYSGVCKVNAAIAAQVLIDGYGCDAIINAGTAGGMDKSLDLFDTVVGTEVVYHDVADHILTGFHPWLAEAIFPADAGLLTAARRTAEGLRHVRFGRMATGEAFITDDGRAEIHARFHPLSVDMESAAVAQVCHAYGVPFLAIRTMTDTPVHRGLGTFEDNCDRAAAVTADFVRRMIPRLKEATR